MAFLNKIRVTITTGRDAGAGTDGSVYLGLAGREFRCDTSADDFERGSTRDYVFGDGANVQRPGDNDPRKPPLRVEDPDIFQAYIRFAQGGNSPWLLEEAAVYIDDETAPRYETDISNNPIWLGDASGCIYYLRKSSDLQRRLRGA
jgi:hypothetical protein